MDRCRVIYRIILLMLVIFTFKREIAFLMGNLSNLLLQLLNEWAFQPFQIFFFFRVNNLPQGFLNPLGDPLSRYENHNHSELLLLMNVAIIH